MNDSPQLSPLTKYIIWENYLICLAIYSITSPRAHNSIQLQISISPKTIYFNLRKLLLHKNSMKKVKGRGECFVNTLHVCSDSPNPHSAEGWTNCCRCFRGRAGVRITIAVLWMQQKRALTLYRPRHHLHSQSAHRLRRWRLELTKRRVRKPVELFCEQDRFFFFSIFFFYFPSTALCFSRLKPTNCISRYSPPTLGLVAYEQKPISAGGNEKKEKKKKRNQASSLGRDSGAECKLPWQVIPGGLSSKKNL